MVEKVCISEQQPKGDAVDTKSLHMILGDKDKPIPISTKKTRIKVDKQKEEADIISKGYNIRPRQQAILDFIRDDPHSYPPTVREIGAGVGLRSSSSVHQHLIKLESQGLIERRAICPRCIVLAEICP